MSEEVQDENLEGAPESSADANPDEKAIASSTIEGAGEQGSPSPESAKKSAPEKSAREQLVAQLTGEVDEDDELDDAAPAKPAAAPAADPVDPPPAEDPAPALDPVTKTGSESEEDDTAPEGTRGKVKKRWDTLIADRKSLRAERDAMKNDAEFGKSVAAVAAEAQMPPPALGAWIALGAEVHREGPQKLPLRLFAEAKRLAAHFRVDLPVEKVIEKSAFDLEAFEATLVDDIADQAIDPAFGKKYLAIIREEKKKSPPQTPPAQPPVQVAPQQQFVHQPPAQNPTPPVQDPHRVTAIAELDRLQTEYAKQLPADWQKLRPKVVEAMAQYKGTDPRHWGKFFKQEVENAKRSLGARKAVISTTTRPSTTQAAPKPKTGRAEILEELTG